MHAAYVPRRDAANDTARSVDKLVLGVFVFRDRLTFRSPISVNSLHLLQMPITSRSESPSGFPCSMVIAFASSSALASTRAENFEACSALLKWSDGPGLERLGGSVDGPVEVFARAMRT